MTTTVKCENPKHTRELRADGRVRERVFSHQGPGPASRHGRPRSPVHLVSVNTGVSYSGHSAPYTPEQASKGGVGARVLHIQAPYG